MQPYIWAILTAIGFGTAPVIEKLGLNKISLWPGLFFRCLGVLIGLFLICLFKFPEIKASVKNLPSGWHYFVWGGLLASVFGQICFYNALKSGEASKLVPIAGAYPLVAFILGILFLHESVTPTKLAGVFFVIIGVICLR